MQAKAALLAGSPDLPREEDVVAETLAAAKRLVPHVVDGVAYINEALERGENCWPKAPRARCLTLPTDRTPTSPARRPLPAVPASASESVPERSAR